MKFLVDAQLPRRVAGWFNEVGHDSVHTLDLPYGNRTTDPALARRADDERRVVVTKDADFVDSHLLLGVPRRLLLISVGNINNLALESLLVPLLPDLSDAFAEAAFVEIASPGVIILRGGGRG